MNCSLFYVYGRVYLPQIYSIECTGPQPYPEPTEDLSTKGHHYTITSKDVIKFLIKVFERHGVPEIITSDNVENRNKEIGKSLHLLGKKNKDWDDILPSALWALRTSKNSVTKFSSFELVYGREDQQHFDISARPTKNLH
ncbi:hypothetical protein PIROE2DRAFT_16784 [Piromyces sp. E2]|nr:hypothetical protein PIROE2DRAFT_16784 [Piromyces sp. E2]|eukprot:OUM58042.1 hypothetical protein PIROE2DRAFT_16784 [Piromyces sp. E2]